MRREVEERNIRRLVFVLAARKRKKNIKFIHLLEDKI